MTVTWVHQNIIDNSGEGVAFAYLSEGSFGGAFADIKFVGGWAETHRTDHTACTPTATAQGHQSGSWAAPMLGSSLDYDGSNPEAVAIHFACPVGATIRAHVFVVT